MIIYCDCCGDILKGRFNKCPPREALMSHTKVEGLHTDLYRTRITCIISQRVTVCSVECMKKAFSITDSDKIVTSCEDGWEFIRTSTSPPI